MKQCRLLIGRLERERNEGARSFKEVDLRVEDVGLVDRCKEDVGLGREAKVFIGRLDFRKLSLDDQCISDAVEEVDDDFERDFVAVFLYEFVEEIRSSCPDTRFRMMDPTECVSIDFVQCPAEPRTNSPSVHEGLDDWYNTLFADFEEVTVSRCSLEKLHRDRRMRVGRYPGSNEREHHLAVGREWKIGVVCCFPLLLLDVARYFTECSPAFLT